MLDGVCKPMGSAWLHFGLVTKTLLIILGVWAGPGAPETIAKVGGFAPTFLKGLQGPRGHPDILQKF